MGRQNLAKKIRDSLPAGALRLLETAGEISEKLKLETALVGGPVRDFLLGRPVGEIDCVVEGNATGNAARLGKELSKQLKGKLITHPRFLTCRVELPGGGRIDLATARTETYSRPGALPAVSPASIEADLGRRDFSVNALAVRLGPREFGDLIDPLGGAADLAGRTLRVLHGRSFIDDPTRVLRGIRFAARLGFGWEGETKKLLIEALEGGCLQTVSGARIKKEWGLLLGEESRIASVRTMENLNLAGSLAGGLRFSTRLLLPHDRIRPALGLAGPRGAETWLVYTMALLDGLAEDIIQAFLARLSFTKKERRAVSQGTFLSAPLRSAARDPGVRLGDLYLMLAGVEREAALFILASETGRAARERLQKCLFPTARLHITGKDLRALGYKPSPAFKDVLDEILKLKVEGKISTRDEELAAVEKFLGGHP